LVVTGEMPTYERGARLLEGGRLRIERELGRGAMGVVFEVEDEHHGRRAAIKIMSADESGRIDPELRLRFLREGRASSKLTSRHAMRVFEVGELPDEERTPFILCELLNGASLGARLERDGPLPPSDVVRFLRQALDAIGEAHADGLIHRDLKPDNLFLTTPPPGSKDAQPIVKVIDFGLVKDTHATQSLTRTGDGFGSPAYMSPEQINAIKQLDPRADIWSLGITMFELLTGRLPFESESISNVFWAVLNTTAPRVRDRRREVAQALDAIVARCLERDPKLRYANAKELDLALAHYENATTDLVIDSPSAPETTREAETQPLDATAMPLPLQRVKKAAPAAPTTKAAARGARPVVVFLASVMCVLLIGGLALFLFVVRGRHAQNPVTEIAPTATASAQPLVDDADASAITNNEDVSDNNNTSSPAPKVVNRKKVQAHVLASSSAPTPAPEDPPPAASFSVEVNDAGVVMRSDGMATTGRYAPPVSGAFRIGTVGSGAGDLSLQPHHEVIKECVRAAGCSMPGYFNVTFYSNKTPTASVEGRSDVCLAAARCTTTKLANLRVDCTTGSDMPDGGGWVTHRSFCVKHFQVTFTR